MKHTKYRVIISEPLARPSSEGNRKQDTGNSDYSQNGSALEKSYGV